MQIKVSELEQQSQVTIRTFADKDIEFIVKRKFNLEPPLNQRRTVGFRVKVTAQIWMLRGEKC